MKRFAIVFFTIFLSVGINLPDEVLARYNIEPNILMMAMAAFIIAGLISHASLGLILLIVFLAVAVNIPVEFTQSIGYDPDIMLVALIALVLLPFTMKQITR